MTVAYATFAIMSLLICLRARHLGEWLGVMDRPDGQRKLHREATPLVGGTAIALPVGLLAAGLAVVSPIGPLYLVLSLLTVALWLLGLIDDRNSLRPSLRLVLSLAAGTAAMWAIPDLQVGHFRFSFLGHALFLDGWAIPFTLLCLVGLQNAVNMADGKNGLVLSIMLIWTGFLALYAPPHLSPLLWALGAMLAVVLAFNLAGKLFLGDGGTYALAILIGLLTVYVYNVAFDALHADVVALWFLVPVLDCLRLIMWRAMQGRSPFSGDRDHLHHHLERLMPWPAGLAVYLTLIALPGYAATVEPRFTLVWALVSLVSYAVLIAAGRRLRAGAPASVSG
jgi:UDP-GlcNAc:undecaprenyl-phosphate GlcNAc-1-phosphate transferase